MNSSGVIPGGAIPRNPAEYHAASYNTSSDIVYFTIAEPFPTTIVTTASASVAIAGVGLLMYFKTRNRKKLP